MKKTWLFIERKCNQVFFEKSSIKVKKYSTLSKDLNWNSPTILKWISSRIWVVSKVLILDVFFQLCFFKSHFEQLRSPTQIFNNSLISLKLIILGQPLKIEILKALVPKYGTKILL